MSVERLKQLISPNLYGVYIPSGCKYLPDTAPYNGYTADNIVSYYDSLDTLQELVDVLNEEFPGRWGDIEVYPMWDVIDQLVSDDFFIGDGMLVWVEVGKEDTNV